MLDAVSTNFMVNFTSIDGKLSAEMQTDNLFLRSVKREDLDNYVRLYTDIDTVRDYADYGKRYQEEGPELWKQKQTENIAKRIDTLVNRWENGVPFSAFAIFKGSEAKEDQFIGHVVAGFGENPGESEAALVIKKEEWNKGYGTEVVKAMRAYLSVIRDLGYEIKDEPFKAIVATARSDNPYSLKLMESAGMQKRSEIENRYGDGVTRQEYIIKAEDL